MRVICRNRWELLFLACSKSLSGECFACIFLFMLPFMRSLWNPCGHQGHHQRHEHGYEKPHKTIMPCRRSKCKWVAYKCRQARSCTSVFTATRRRRSLGGVTLAFHVNTVLVPNNANHDPDYRRVECMLLEPELPPHLLAAVRWPVGWAVFDATGDYYPAVRPTTTTMNVSGLGVGRAGFVLGVAATVAGASISAVGRYSVCVMGSRPMVLAPIGVLTV